MNDEKDDPEEEFCLKDEQFQNEMKVDVEVMVEHHDEHAFILQARSGSTRIRSNNVSSCINRWVSKHSCHPIGLDQVHTMHCLNHSLSNPWNNHQV